jgi:RHS repeat-associated protein
MKNTIKTCLALLLGLVATQNAFSQAPGVNPTATQNNIVVYTPQVAGVVTSTGLDSASTDKTKLQALVQYFDGLGRPVQTVQVKGSPGGYDIVQPMAYDAYEREPTKYLPYTVTGSGANDGSYKTSALSSQAGYYAGPPAGVTPTPFPWSGTTLEASPLGRPLEQGAPGDNWQIINYPGNPAAVNPGHTVKISYTGNNNITWANDSVHSMQVALYNVTINANSNLSRTLVAGGYYSAGQLDVTVTADENWKSGRAGTMETYTDKQGHVVLKRTYNYTTSLQALSTYYVYDDLGNLAYVVPPAAGGDAAATIGATILNNLCYQYRYDSRNRLSQKKLPGKGWEFTVYNILDQPVATQDSLQRLANNWIVTKYDAMGRTVMTGTWNNNNTAVGQAPLQSTLSAITTTASLYEIPAAGGNGYTNVAWPTTYVTTTLSLNYYDSYSNIPGLLAGYQSANALSTMTLGLLTSRETAVLNTPADMLWDVMYYDDLGRTVAAYAQHYLGGVANTNNYDLTNTTYNFLNLPLTVTRQHWNTASTSAPLVTIANTYVYDHMARKLQTWEQISGGTNVLLSDLAYNETGQLMTKNLHGANVSPATAANITLGAANSVSSGTQTVTATNSIVMSPGFSVAPGAAFTAQISGYLQSISYTYNERGWLTSSSAPLFAMQLTYNTAARPQYNGNIASQLWGTPGSLANSFVYTYDKVNRLTSGATPGGQYIERGITYDPEGNISTLSRVYAGTVMDSLSYSYSGTNQLQSVTDKSANAATNGYPSGTYTYAYDGNGNMVTDNSKGITGSTGIVYNLLNLPQSISSKGIVYTYSATGEKLRRAVTSGSNTTYTDYISGIEYDGAAGAETITFIQTEEGRVLAPTTAPNYEYTLTDHLGDSRLSFDTGTGAARTEQQDNYMPFGLDISVGTIGSPQNYYLYNKKELQPGLGLDDYGARFYDPVIGRWTTPDPLSEKLPGWSPYNYVLNNPMKLFDPDGLFPFPVTVRAFAPPGSFSGSGFDDDKRGFSANTNASSRLSQTTTIDPTTGEVSGGHVTSTGTHFFGIPVGNAENFSSEGSVDRIGMSGSGDNHTLSVDEHLTGSDPAGLKLAPDVMLNSGISLTENDKAGYLDANITLTGKGFPASEAIIGDTGGKNILLTGAATYGGLTDLIKNDPKQVASIGVRISIDGKGNFTGITYNGKNYSVADWNKAQQAAPAGPHHNYSKQNIQGQTEQ